MTTELKWGCDLKRGEVLRTWFGNQTILEIHRPFRAGLIEFKPCEFAGPSLNDLGAGMPAEAITPTRDEISKWGLLRLPSGRQEAHPGECGC